MLFANNKNLGLNDTHDCKISLNLQSLNVTLTDKKNTANTNPTEINELFAYSDSNRNLSRNKENS